MNGVIEKKSFSSICIVDNIRWHRSVGSGGAGDAFSIGSSLNDDEEGVKQGHPYFSQNNVSDSISSRPMRYIYFEVGVSLYLMCSKDHWLIKK